MTTTRYPAVAGQFYPEVAEKITQSVLSLLEGVSLPESKTESPLPKALIVPHAGYVYSGAIAASAYALIRPVHDIITRVILLGPCHRVAVQGMALSSANYFSTPLGDIPVDQDGCQKIHNMPEVQIFDKTHELEHSLEVHLPFLQTILDKFSIIPIVVGSATPEAVANVINTLWGGPETLIIISSDLSHYKDYQSARKIDLETCQAIENLAPENLKPEGSCGRYPVAGFLTLAKRRRMTVVTLDLRNSGDTAGPKDKVVGYGSWSFTELQRKPPSAIVAWTNDSSDIKESENTITNSDTKGTQSIIERYGTELTKLAAKTIEYGLVTGITLSINLANYPTELTEEGACFVTLKVKGKLRGCIGTSTARRPLISDIVENAYSAAFHDPRFSSLTPSELPGLELSVSVISPQTEMSFANEADFITQIRPKIDGLVIEDKGSRALFLPSVWSGLPEVADFLSHLKTKAGLKPDHWSPDFKAWRFTSEEYTDYDLWPILNEDVDSGDIFTETDKILDPS